MGGDSRCQSNHIEWQYKCLRIFNGVTESWSDSQKECQRENGNLLDLSQQSIPVSEVLKLIQGYGVSEMWIGARKQKSWYWSEDGTTNPGTSQEIVRSFWGDNEPNFSIFATEDRISLYKAKDYRWNDESSSKKSAGVVFFSSYYKALCQCSISKCGNPHSSGIEHILDHSGQRYFTTDEEYVTWNEAWTECKKYNAKLVKIETEDLQTKLQKELPLHGSYHYWTAGYWDEQKEMSFTWNGGSAIDNVDISSLNKANDNLCVTATDQMKNTYRAAKCDEDKPFICQYDHEFNTLTTQTTTPTTTTPTTTTTTTPTTTTPTTTTPTTTTQATTALTTTPTTTPTTTLTTTPTTTPTTAPTTTTLTTTMTTTPLTITTTKHTTTPTTTSTTTSLKTPTTSPLTTPATKPTTTPTITPTTTPETTPTKTMKAKKTSATTSPTTSRKVLMTQGATPTAIPPITPITKPTTTPTKTTTSAKTTPATTSPPTSPKVIMTQRTTPTAIPPITTTTTPTLTLTTPTVTTLTTVMTRLITAATSITSTTIITPIGSSTMKSSPSTSKSTAIRKITSMSSPSTTLSLPHKTSSQSKSLVPTKTLTRTPQKVYLNPLFNVSSSTTMSNIRNSVSAHHQSSSTTSNKRPLINFSIHAISATGKTFYMSPQSISTPYPKSETAAHSSTLSIILDKATSPTNAKENKNQDKSHRSVLDMAGLLIKSVNPTGSNRNVNNSWTDRKEGHSSGDRDITPLKFITSATGIVLLALSVILLILLIAGVVLVIYCWKRRKSEHSVTPEPQILMEMTRSNMSTESPNHFNWK